MLDLICSFLQGYMIQELIPLPSIYRAQHSKSKQKWGEEGEGGTHRESEDAWLGEPAELIEDAERPMAIRMEKATLSPRAPDAVLDLSTCTGSRSEEMGKERGTF